jgi:hypothetical protein
MAADGGEGGQVPQLVAGGGTEGAAHGGLDPCGGVFGQPNLGLGGAIACD